MCEAMAEIQQLKRSYWKLEKKLSSANAKFLCIFAIYGLCVYGFVHDETYMRFCVMVGVFFLLAFYICYFSLLASMGYVVRKKIREIVAKSNSQFGSLS